MLAISLHEVAAFGSQDIADESENSAYNRQYAAWFSIMQEDIATNQGGLCNAFW